MQKLFYWKNIKQTKRKSSKKPRENLWFLSGFGLPRKSSGILYHPLNRKSISAFYNVHSSLQKRNLSKK